MGNVAIEVAVGLFFAFWVLSLIATGMTEWIANLTDMRGKHLLRGIKGLLDGKSSELPKDLVAIPGSATPYAPATPTAAQTLRSSLAASASRGATDADKAAAEAGVESVLTEAVLQHPLVLRMRRPRKRLAADRKLVIPSYMSSKTFARAFLDTLVPDLDENNPPAAAKLARVKDTVKRLPDNLQRPLLVFIEEANDDIAEFRLSVEGWFDEQMDRVNGWYKRWAKRIALLVGLGVAVLFNVSAFDMATTLYREPSIRAALVAQADACTAAPNQPPVGSGAAQPQPADGTKPCASFESLKTSRIPVGWSFGTDCGGNIRCWNEFSKSSIADRAIHVAGWLFTAAAISLSAPFWFDAMNRVGSLRNAGKKPDKPDRPR